MIGRALSVQKQKKGTFTVKGIVFSFNRKSSKSVRLPKIGSLIKSYRVTLIFLAVLLAGLVLGAFYAKSADSSFLKSIDFLFMTNLDARLKQGAFGVFCACFASDFLFLLSLYMFGMTLWGIPFEFFTVLFKGFGTGLTAGYLSLSYSLSGAGFYLLVLLPGTFLFCVFLAKFSASAFYSSKIVLTATLKKDAESYNPRHEAITLGSKFLSSLIAAFSASVLDTVLWTLFAGTFKF